MRTSEIAALVGGTLHGRGEIEITSAASLEKAGSGQIAFAERGGVPERVTASCLIVAEGDGFPVGDYDAITVGRPKLAFARVASALHPPKVRGPEVHPTAIVASGAQLGSGIFVGPFVHIGEGSSIGDGTQLRAGAKIGDRVTIGGDCVIHPNVFVEDGCTIGDRVVLHSGVVVGSDGFGYVRDAAGNYVKFPQIGTVIIEDDVEIGANTCVDRGALGETRIGAGTKIDNLVQVGHNVHIGRNCVIAAQTGISGSVVIEDNCVIGGQVGFGDHVTVRSGAVIGSQAGVLPGKIVRSGVWWGTPIQPLEDFKRQNAHVKGLGRLRSQVSRLVKQIEGGDRSGSEE
jgi:UDP-3-O-[3-hydroxymyristoyl] glucosamine N-acyltransferase